MPPAPVPAATPTTPASPPDGPTPLPQDTVKPTGTPPADALQSAAQKAGEPQGYSRDDVQNWYKGAIQNPVETGDLGDQDKTQQATVNALGWLHDNSAPSVTVTSINSGHHDDSKLGPHGHTNGYSVDVKLGDPSQLDDYLDKLSQNPYVTKIGLGGAYYTKDALSHVTGGKIAFRDNDSTHVHFQTDEHGNIAPPPPIPKTP